MKQIQQQIDEIGKELEDRPQDPELLNELGVGYYLLGEYQRSIAALKKAADLAPGNHRIQYNLGNSLYENEQLKQATHHLMNAIEIKGDYIPALNNLADVYEQAGETERTGDLFRYIIKIKPNDAMGYFNLGNFYLRQNDTVKAGKQYQKTIAIDPDYYEAYNNIGYILKHLEKYEEAIPYFKRCLAINPDFEPAKKDLEFCLEKRQ